MKTVSKIGLIAALLLTSPLIAGAQNVEPLEAARTPSKPLRLEQPAAAKKQAHTELDPGVTDDISKRSFFFTPKVKTIFPLFLGGGVEVAYKNRFALGVDFGFTPKAYSKAIAEAASSLGNDPSYKSVIEAAFQHNSSVRGYFEYRFRAKTSGWRVGTAISKMKADGSAPIDTTLEAATGRSFANLVALLIAQGKDPNVNMKTDLMLAELYTGYGWNPAHNVLISFDFGLAKVLSSDVHLKTDLPAYENSAAGKSQLRGSESDLEGIIEKYGFTPTLALTAGYTF